MEKVLTYLAVLIYSASFLYAGDIQLFEDKSSFISASGDPQYSIDFETLPDGSDLSDTLLVGDEWATYGIYFSPENNIQIWDVNSHPPTWNPSSMFNALCGSPVDSSSITIVFNPPVFSVGFTICDSETGYIDEYIEVYNFQNELLASYPLPQSGVVISQPGPNYFRGFISSDPISKISILEDNTDGDGVLYDDIIYNHASILIVDNTNENVWGDHQYDAIYVINGGSITIPPAEWNGNSWEKGWLRLVTDYLYIESGCSIRADGAGYNHFDGHSDGGSGAGQWSIGTGSPPGGGGYGGEGGHLPFGGWGGSAYGTCTQIDYGEGGIPQMGSMGGNLWDLNVDPEFNPIFLWAEGGEGGGGFEITAQNVEIEGTLSANGGHGEEYAGGYGSGGGSGGQIVIDAATVHVKSGGQIQANGGSTSIAGAGGGGRILIASTDFTNDGTIEAEGGIAYNSNANGHSGTVCTPETNCPVGDPVSAPPTDLDLHPDDDTGVDQHDHLTNLSNPRITGNSIPESSIELYSGGSIVGSGSCDSNGSFTIQASLSDGEHTITATATQYCHDPSTQSTDSVTITVNTQQVPKPAIPDMIESGVSGGWLLDDNIISDPRPTFEGTVGVESTVKLFVDGTYITEQYTADGSYSMYPPNYLSEGYHQVGVRIMDTAGNESDTSTLLSIRVDLTDPTITNKQVSPVNCQSAGTVFTVQCDVSDSFSGVNISYGVDVDIKLSDNTKIDSIELQHQGGNFFSGTWDSTGADAGSYKLDFSASDIAGNSVDVKNEAVLCVEEPTPYCGDDTHPYPVGDLTKDCYVNDSDLNIFAIYWLYDTCLVVDCGGADVDGDGKVNLHDVALLTQTWLECTDPYEPCNYMP